MKTITIDGKEYRIDCNAFTAIQHRKIFNRGILNDINILNDYMVTQTIVLQKIQNENPNISETEMLEKVSEVMMTKIDDFIEAVTRVTYTLIYCANENIEDYDTFLKGIKKFKISDKWIAEVTELAVDCFC